METATALQPAAATPAVAVRLVVDGAGTRVLFAEAGEDAVAFLSSLLAAPVRAAFELLLQEDPPAAAAGCFGNLLSAGALLLPRAAASASRARPPSASPISASRPPTGTGAVIMSRRIFRCDSLGCRCSDIASRVPGSPCPCRSCPTCGGGATRGTELQFLESCFYRRPDGSAASSTRGGGQAGDTFYRCHARDGRHGGRDFIQCRYRVTDERGVECPLCHSLTTVAVKLAKPKGGGGDDDEGYSARRPRAAAAAPGLGFAVMDDLSVRPMADGMSRAALLAELGVADPASVREEVVPFGYKQGLSIIWASLQMKTVLTEVFLRTNAECWEDTTKGHPEWKKLKYGPPEYLPLLEQIGSTSNLEEDQEDADGFEVRQESLMSTGSHKRNNDSDSSDDDDELIAMLFMHQQHQKKIQQENFMYGMYHDHCHYNKTKRKSPVMPSSTMEGINKQIAEIRQAQQLALQAGVDVKSVEYFALSLICKEEELRGLFIQMKTATERLAFLKRYCREKNLM